jgi:hypothetical protein
LAEKIVWSLSGLRTLWFDAVMTGAPTTSLSFLLLHQCISALEVLLDEWVA